MKILYRELCDLIIKAAIEIQTELGAGFLEKVYENALIIALRELSLMVEQQKKIEVTFRG
ncbi:MAG: GxxExxY protein, partial [FCB group bacterium]|nr:GxxExxY protein [FCB group bacterium]